MISRGELKGRILRLLNKTPNNQGYFTDDKINDAIQETLDFIATEMFMVDEGWQTKIQYFDTTENQIKIDLPPHISLIKEVRYLWGNVYTTVRYDSANEQEQYAPGSGVTQWASRYRLVDNALYFNPVLTDTGPNFLQIEYMSYPQKILDDNMYLEPHFDNGMQHYIKYRSASILASSFGKSNKEWAGLEQEWYDKMLAIATRRNMQTTRIREFC